MTLRRFVKLDFDVALRSHDELGEGPVWLPETGELLRVDIAAGVLHRWAPATGKAERVEAGDCVTAAVPRRDGGLVVARRHGVELWDDTGESRTLVELERDRAGNRCNDAKADPAGRLWVGTMSTTREAGAAALYRVQADGRATPVIPGTTVSNGIGWSPSGTRMYFADSPTGRIDVLDYDRATGAVRDRRPFAAIDAGIPDGLTVDAEGAVWIALFGGGQVRRYAPDGTLAAVAELPVDNPTSVTFGGPDLATLYVTSARGDGAPLAGAVFALEPGVGGLPVDRFAG
jgi:sugar lactone lactonase YvrE